MAEEKLIIYTFRRKEQLSSLSIVAKVCTLFGSCKPLYWAKFTEVIFLVLMFNHNRVIRFSTQLTSGFCSTNPTYSEFPSELSHMSHILTCYRRQKLLAIKSSYLLFNSKTKMILFFSRKTKRKNNLLHVKGLIVYYFTGRGGRIQNMDSGPWTTPVDPVHGPPLAERVFRRRHVETMEEGEITHCFLDFWICSFVNILRSIRGRYILLFLCFWTCMAIYQTMKAPIQTVLDYTYLKA